MLYKHTVMAAKPGIVSTTAMEEEISATTIGMPDERHEHVSTNRKSVVRKNVGLALKPDGKNEIEDRREASRRIGESRTRSDSPFVTGWKERKSYFRFLKWGGSCPKYVAHATSIIAFTGTGTCGRRPGQEPQGHIESSSSAPACGWSTRRQCALTIPSSNDPWVQ